MQRILAVVLALFCVPAFAADVTTSMAVLKEGAVVYEQTNRFVGMTDQESIELQKAAMKVLDFASKQQEKGGSYTIRWQWSGQPALETTGMTFSAVNATMHKGAKWLDDIAVDADKKAAQKKGKPWGK